MQIALLMSLIACDPSHYNFLFPVAFRLEESNVWFVQGSWVHHMEPTAIQDSKAATIVSI